MRRRGFTLLETLVALTVTAIVLAALGQVVLGTATARTRATAASDRIGSARTVLVRMAREVEAALAGEQFVVEPPPTPGTSSQLRFVTVTPPGVPGGIDLRAVAYAVPPGLATLTRASRDTRSGQPVLDGVRRFTVRCFDGTTWHDAWPPGALPRAVALGLELEHEATPLTTTVTVATARR